MSKQTVCTLLLLLLCATTGLGQSSGATTGASVASAHHLGFAIDNGPLEAFHPSLRTPARHAFLTTIAALLRQTMPPFPRGLLFQDARRRFVLSANGDLDDTRRPCLQGHVEVFNLFNRVNFSPDEINRKFARDAQGRFKLAPRQFQLGLRLSF